MTRREFVSTSALATGNVIVGAGGAGAKEYDTGKIVNYNENMEYRRLGKTGLMVSAVCLGGHWKRVGLMMSKPFKGAGYMKEDMDNVNDPEFIKNRHDVVSRSIDAGINYVDACAPAEILAYSKVLKGRREKMYFGYSWHLRESRFKEWRTGKARFVGVSTHNRPWLVTMIKQYPDQMEAVLFPYTAASKILPKDSLFDVVKECDVGVLGIKPFADNSLFVGDSAPNGPYAEQDDRRARMAIRYILGNPAITAPIPGLINLRQVDNAAKAVRERRELDLTEKAELEQASRRMWANLRPHYQWLRDWEYV